MLSQSEAPTHTRTHPVLTLKLEAVSGHNGESGEKIGVFTTCIQAVLQCSTGKRKNVYVNGT